MDDILNNEFCSFLLFFVYKCIIIIIFYVRTFIGPNNVKQNFEAFTNNGQLNSLYVLFNTPGGGNTIRIRNQNTVEFPFRAYVSAVKK
jgi:hypothetical protein